MQLLRERERLQVLRRVSAGLRKAEKRGYWQDYGTDNKVQRIYAESNYD